MLRLIGVFVAFAWSAHAQETGPFASFDLASEQVLNDPHDLAFGPNGNLYIADKFGNRVVVMDPETLAVVEVLGDGLFPGIHDIDFGPDGRAILAVTGLSAALIYADVAQIGQEPDIMLRAPRTEGALAHSNGQNFVMASGIGALGKFTGTDLMGVAEGHLGAHDVAEDLSGHIWVADTNNRRLVRYSETLEEVQVLDDPKFGLVGPRYLAIDDFGRLVVVDQDAHRVLLIAPETEELLGVLGSGAPGMGPNLFDDPEGVAVRGNRYFFADSDNNRIVRYTVVMN